MIKNTHVLSAVSAMIVLLLLTGKAGAQQQQASFDNYYTVRENPVPSSQHPEIDPLQTVQEIFENEYQTLSEIRAAVLSLFNFVHHQDPYGDTAQPYNRTRHFGGWVRGTHGVGCQNTRAQVLVRDSLEKVSFNSKGCVVTQGKWIDPYSAQTVTVASQLDIDHFVPLKNAYLSGAHKWGFERRCLYANYRGNNFHLLAVSNSENRSKGDKSPLGYMPENPAYRCQYLSQWLKVKLIWSLGLTPPEREALIQLAQANHCSASLFEFKVQDLTSQRKAIEDAKDLCR